MSDELRAGRAAEIAHKIINGSFGDSAAMDAAHALEDEIERRGRNYEYEQALLCVVYGRAVQHWELGDVDLWLLIRATPEQRAQAFLTAVSDA